MKCDACDLRDAIIHVRQMQRAGMQELHLCEECARERGYLREEEAELPLAPLLAGLMAPAQAAPGSAGTVTCPRCGLSAAEFRKRGRAGCARCYEVFDQDLRAMLSQMAGRPRHAGKMPRELAASVSARPDRETMRVELKEAVEREDYERAARLRDKLRELDDGG